ncbi:MAG: PhoH family protein [Alphaproteobacteria bacterium]
MNTEKNNDEKIVKEYSENIVFLQLVGPQNCNIDKIERELNVTIQTIGNKVVVIGKSDATKAVVSILDSLYDRAKKGLHIENADIDAAIRMNFGGKVVASATERKTDDLTIKTRKRHISPRTATQAEYIKAMLDNELVFGLGPAGTGKTYLAVALAVSMMIEGKVDRIILSRPAVEAGEHLGFLPGDLKEKVDPYLRPLYDALYDMMPSDQVDKKLESGEIEIAPLAFMRGRTLANSVVILDEAQNTTPMQMKMFLTRLGENSRMVINGDLSQTDLPGGTISGMSDSLEILEKISGIAVVNFTEKDVVRHGLVAKIVKAYDDRFKAKQKAKS